MTLKDEDILENERRNTRTLSVENSLCKQLCISCKIDYVVAMMMMMMMMLIEIFTLLYRLHPHDSVNVCLGEKRLQERLKTHTAGPTDALRIC